MALDLLIGPHHYCWLGQVGDRAADLLKALYLVSKHVLALVPGFSFPVWVWGSEGSARKRKAYMVDFNHVSTMRSGLGVK